MKDYTVLLWSVFLNLSISICAQDFQSDIKILSIEELKSQIDSLKTLYGREIDLINQTLKSDKPEKSQEHPSSEIQDLLIKAKTMGIQKSESESESRKFHSGLRQQSALNPNISIGGEFYFSAGKSKSELNRNPSETNWGTGQLFMREIEVGVESALDPFSQGKVFLGFDGEAASVEEAYITWLNCPLNMNMKLGKFKGQFGRLNRFHNHALPQFDRPRVLVQFFGNECLHGIGIAGNFLLPRLWAHVNELDLEIISGGNGFSFTNEGRHNLIFITHLKNYYDLNRSTYLEVGLSSAGGKSNQTESISRWIGGTDITVKWQPPGRSKYRGAEWRTELLCRIYESAASGEIPWGGFTSLQIRLGSRILTSMRLDCTDMPQNSSLWERGISLSMDYWQSEFVFMRLQYSWIDRNFDEPDNRVILHTCWAMGPHRHETY